MADLKISQLTAVGTVVGTNEIPVNEAGTTKKATVTQIFTLLGTTGLIITGDWTWQGLDAYRCLTLQVYSTTDAKAPYISFNKSGQNTVGNAATVDGEDLGFIDVRGNSGSAFVEGAYIQFQQDGAMGTKTPTRIMFKTSDGTNITERMRIYSSGIVDLYNQSRARVYLAYSQPIPINTYIQIAFNAETYDSQNEFYTTEIVSTATSTSAFHLVDTTAPFVAGDVGKTVWNITDSTYATITVFNSASDVTIDVDIMTNGESYRVYNSRFIAKQSGYYQVNASLFYTAVEAGKDYPLFIQRNGVNISVSYGSAAAGMDCQVKLSDIIYLAAGQYLQMLANHNSATAKTVIAGSYYTYLSIHKLS